MTTINIEGRTIDTTHEFPPAGEAIPIILAALTPCISEFYEAGYEPGLSFSSETHFSNRTPTTTMQPETAPDPRRGPCPKRNHQSRSALAMRFE